MNDTQWQKVEQIFLAALEREPDDCAAFVVLACEDNESLREEVESLLAAHREAGSFIESTALEDGLKIVAEGQAKQVAGRRIGPYKIVSEIGRGGMGAVYLAARDDEQYEKRVAIKLIKRGMDTDLIIRRFWNERQILANLDHPNIARLLDGGTTEDGLPYFVMEYIEGKPLDEYCDGNKLSTVERLKLFRKVCSAVHYAHQNLVIHRDLKPGNVLVTADGMPKLLDFGIAKLLGAERAPEAVNRTATVARIMTPEYASPEQVRGEPVTTTSDVYSLGVLLYELLTGHRPYRITSHSPEEISRAICDQEPDKPSAALSRVEAQPGTDGKAPLTPELVSEARDDQPNKLRRKLRGDLDNIVLMAIRKEAGRRYASVEQFSEDLRRHLEGLPVMARRDTFSYRSAKFVKRNKTAVLAAALVLVILVGALIVTMQKSRAAQLESTKAQRINRFLQDMLSYADPSWYSPGHGKRGDVKVRDVLDEASQRIETELADQPAVRAELHHTIGNTYRALGFYQAAEQHLRASLNLYSEIYGERHAKVAEGIYYVAAIKMAKGDWEAAEPLFQQAIATMRSVDQENINLPYMLEDYAGLFLIKGDNAAAEPLLTEALGLFHKHYGENHIAIASIYEAFGLIDENRGEFDKAQAMCQEAIERYRRLEGSPTSQLTLIVLGRIAMTKGEYGEAEIRFQEALKVARDYHGNTHPFVAQPLTYSADLHCRMQSYARAKEEIESALEIQRQLLPQGKKDAFLLSLLSKISVKTGQPAQAEIYLTEALQSYNNEVETGYTGAQLLGSLGECLILLRRCGEAEPLLLKNYDTSKARWGEKHPWTLEAIQRLVKLYEEWKKPEQAGLWRARLST